MKRFFRLALGGLVLLAVMLFSAALTLRLAIHGGEVTIPDFAGMTAAEASEAALRTGLDLNIENKFYSTTVPAGRMLSQAPAPGSRVRKRWKVRVTESLGPQQVTIPNVSAQTQREAAMNLRRASLDLGTLAHINAPGDPDMVLAQTPPPDAGVDQPRVSLLLSSQAGDATNAVVLPSFVGLGYTAAIRSANALGIRLNYVDLNPQPAPSANAAGPSPITFPSGASPAASSPASPSPIATAPPGSAAQPFTVGPGGVHLDANGVAIPLAPSAPVAPSGPSGPVTGQKPEAGYRATRGDLVRITFGHALPAPSASTPGASSSPASSSAPANTTATPH